MNIKILQADIKTPYKFMSFKYAEQHGFSLSDYAMVYSGETTAETLDGIFSEFNHDYKKLNENKMHSLSVSDIVIRDDGIFYCDSFGWRKIVGKKTNKKI